MKLTLSQLVVVASICITSLSYAEDVANSPVLPPIFKSPFLTQPIFDSPALSPSNAIFDQPFFNQPFFSERSAKQQLMAASAAADTAASSSSVCPVPPTGGCSVCGEGMCVEKPNAIFEIPGMVDPVPCFELQNAGYNGTIGASECIQVTMFVTASCGCTAEAPAETAALSAAAIEGSVGVLAVGALAPTDSINSLAPVGATAATPVSPALAPVFSPIVPSAILPPAFAPTAIDEASGGGCPAVPAGGCSVCGDGMCVENPDAIFEIPGMVDPVPCSELQNAGYNGTITPGQCSQVTMFVTSMCGCVSSAVAVPAISQTEAATTTVTVKNDPVPKPVASPTRLPTRKPTARPSAIRTRKPTPAPISSAPTTVAPITTSPVTFAPIVTSPPIGAVINTAAAGGELSGGCPVVPEGGCSVCGEGLCVEKPNAIFSIPGVVDPVACSELQNAGYNGTIAPGECVQIPMFVRASCGCVAAAPVAIETTIVAATDVAIESETTVATDAPITAAPITVAPVSTAPVTSSSSAAGSGCPVVPEGGCSVCGEGLCVEKPNAIFEIPGVVDPVACSELQNAGYNGTIAPGECVQIPMFVRASCGCVAAAPVAIETTIVAATDVAIESETTVATDAPVTAAPITVAPVTAAPITVAPVSTAPVTSSSSAAGSGCPVVPEGGCSVCGEGLCVEKPNAIFEIPGVVDPVACSELQNAGYNGTIAPGECVQIPMFVRASCGCVAAAPVAIETTIVAATDVAIESETTVATDAPITAAPITVAPVTAAPITVAPVSTAPVTSSSSAAGSGCPVVPEGGCSVCGEGLCVEKPNAIFEIPGVVDPVACSELQNAGYNGTIAPGECVQIPMFVRASCGCVAAAPVAIETTIVAATDVAIESETTVTTDAPVTAAPITVAPITVAPVTAAPITVAPVSTAPVTSSSSAAGSGCPVVPEGGCSVCGEGLCVEKPNAIFEIPGVVDPVACSELQNAGYNGTIAPGECVQIPMFVRASCGCVAAAPVAIETTIVAATDVAIESETTVATDAPVTAAPITVAPVTAAPITVAPVTAAPITVAPVSTAPVTSSSSAAGSGCPVVPEGGCSVCGEGLCVEKPNAIFSIPGVVDPVACSELQNAGYNGTIAPGECVQIPMFVRASCGCVAAAPVAIETTIVAATDVAIESETTVATDAPITAAPITVAPVTAAPITVAPVSTAPVTSSSSAAGSGCPVVPEGGCSVCGEGLCVEKPNAIFEIPGVVDPVACSELQNAGYNGTIAPGECVQIPMFVRASCGCVAAAPVAIETTIVAATDVAIESETTVATDAPITAAPITVAPVSTAPVTSSSSAAGSGCPVVPEGGCSVCGEGLCVEKPNAIFEIPGVVDPVACSELQNAGYNGTIAPGECVQIPMFVRASCGCVAAAPAETATIETATTTTSETITFAPIISVPVTAAPATSAPVVVQTDAPIDEPMTEPAKEAPTRFPTTKPTSRPAVSAATTTSAITGLSCPVVPAGGCSVCGDGLCVENPDAIFEIPGMVDPVPCSELQNAGYNGTITPGQCSQVTMFVTSMCGCVAGPAVESETTATTNAPVTAAPVTFAPVAVQTDAPIDEPVAEPAKQTPTRFPTSQPTSRPTGTPTNRPGVSVAATPSTITGSGCPVVPAGGCSVCGQGKCVTEPNAIFSIVGFYDPIPCSELQEEGYKGAFSEDDCGLIPLFSGDVCGCMAVEASAATTEATTLDFVTTVGVVVTSAPITVAPNLPSPTTAPEVLSSPPPVSVGVPSGSDSPSGSRLPSGSDMPSTIPEAQAITSAPFTAAPVSSSPACPVVPDGGCSVCGAGMCVSKPDAMFSIPGVVDPVPCFDLQEAGYNGTIAPADCALIPSFVVLSCGCVDGAVSTASIPPPTPPPTLQAPVFAPSGSDSPSGSDMPSMISEAQAITSAPFTAAPVSSSPACPVVPDGGCSVCGAGMCVSKPDAMFSIPGVVDPVPCFDLQEAGYNGTIARADCALLPSFAEVICGCVDGAVSTAAIPLPTLVPSPPPASPPTLQATLFAPSASSSPSGSHLPSMIPSVFEAETTSSAVTAAPVSSSPACPVVPYGGCSVCGAGMCVSKPDAVFSIPGVVDPVPCFDLQEAGYNGTIAPADCALLPSFAEVICGCVDGAVSTASIPPPTPPPTLQAPVFAPSGSDSPSGSDMPSMISEAQATTSAPFTAAPVSSSPACPVVPDGGCSVCGAGMCVSKPDATFSIPGVVDPVPCFDLQEAGYNGTIAPGDCALLPSFAEVICGCVEGAVSTAAIPPPTPPPTLRAISPSIAPSGSSIPSMIPSAVSLSTPAPTRKKPPTISFNFPESQVDSLSLTSMPSPPPTRKTSPTISFVSPTQPPVSDSTFAPIPSPALMPVEEPVDFTSLACRDAPDDYEFYVFSLAEWYTCAFLRTLPELDPRLCTRFEEPYYTCPDLCGRCQTLNPLANNPLGRSSSTSSRIGYKGSSSSFDSKVGFKPVAIEALPCVDSIISFFVDEEYGMQTCASVEENAELQSALCIDHKMAYYLCPRVCQRCVD